MRCLLTVGCLLLGVAACGEGASAPSNGGKASPPPARSAKRIADAAASPGKREATGDVVAPAKAPSTAAAKEPPGVRVQRGIVGWISGDDAGAGWRSSTLTRGTLGACDVDSVGVERRFESATDVVIEAIVGFESPTERGRVLVWATLDGQGRATGLHAVGDMVWAARCRKACARGGDDCPAPRLSPVPQAPSQETIVPGAASRAAELTKAYAAILALDSTTGGFGTLIAPEVMLEDATSGRSRRGVEGFVDALRAVERRFSKARSVAGLQMAVFGDHLVARFTFVGTDAAGKVSRLQAMDVTRFDRRGRLEASRGYALVLSP